MVRAVLESGGWWAYVAVLAAASHPGHALAGAALAGAVLAVAVLAVTRVGGPPPPPGAGGHRRAIAVRQRARRARLPRLLDPDAPGRPRPRAPGRLRPAA